MSHTMSITEAVYADRPVREFLPTAVSEAAVHALLYAGVQASSGFAAESWAFVIIQNAAVLKDLFGSDMSAQAGTLIVIYGQSAVAFAVAQNIRLAAVGMGLGSCLAAQALETLNTTKWKVRLNVPKGLAAIVPLLIGYPALSADGAGHPPPDILSWIG